MTRTRSAALVLGVIATLSRTAQAQPSTDVRAEELFQSGQKKFDVGRHVEACADFSESLKLGPKLGTLLNVALCHETVGKLATAWSEFQHAAAWAAQNGQRDRPEYAMQHVQSLQTRLPRVVLQLPANRALTAIDLDGEPLPEQRWYLPLYLDPGEHSLALTAPGKKRGTVVFRVVNSPTDQLVMVPALPDADPPRVIESGPGSTVHGRERTAGFIALGSGAAAVAASVVFAVLAATADDSDTAKGRAMVSAIVGGAGLLTVGAGTYLVVTNATGRGTGGTGGTIGLARSF